MEVQWRPRIAVVDIPSSDQAIDFTFSGIERVLKQQVFFTKYLVKIAVRRKSCDVTAASGGPRELTG